MKDFGTWQDLSYDDFKTIRSLGGVKFGNNIHGVIYTAIRKFGDSLLLVTMDRNSQGIYDCYEGEWSNTYYLTLISKDFTSGKNLGQFKLKYVEAWPQRMEIQTMYNEKFNKDQIYIEEDKLHIEIIKEWWGKVPVHISRGDNMYSSWRRSNEPIKTELQTLEFEMSPR